MNFRLPVLFAALGLLFAAAGCRTETGRGDDGRTFDRVASRLDAGGSYFMIANPRYLIDGLEREGSRFAAMIAQSELPKEIRDPFVLFSAAFEIGWHLSGIDELEGYGMSSRVFQHDKEGRPRLFTNRSTILLRPEAQGAIWSLVGRKNRPLTEEFNALPVGTAFAADFEFHPEALWEALCRTDRSAGDVDRFTRTLLNMPLEKLLRSLSGEIGMLLFLERDADPETLEGVRALLVLNDRERLLFQLAQRLPGEKTDENTFILEPVSRCPGLVLSFIHADSMLYVVLGSDTMEKLGSAPRLAETPEFRELAEGLPAEGSGFFYVGPQLAGFLEKLLNRLFDDKVAFSTGRPAYGLAVTRCEADGYTTVAHASVDYNEIDFLEQLALPFFTFVVALSEQFNERQETIEAGQALAACRRRLEVVRDALMKYAAGHDGAFPAQAGISGLRELLSGGFLSPGALICPGSEDESAKDVESFTFDNCSYLYFEGLTRKSNPKLPLLIDWPFNHAGRVNVILVDGTIETLEVPEAENCRKIASYLQTRYQYSEAEFRELFRKAARLDQQFELE